MIHEAYMPVYMGPRFSLHTGPPEVVQEALADLKRGSKAKQFLTQICQSQGFIKKSLTQIRYLADHDLCSRTGSYPWTEPAPGQDV